MIIVQGLITQHARYNRLHLLRCIWLFSTLGTNLSEWGLVRTRIHHDENSSRRVCMDTSELIECSKWIERWDWRYAKRHSDSLHDTRRLHGIMPRECTGNVSSLTILSKTFTSAHRLTLHLYSLHLLSSTYTAPLRKREWMSSNKFDLRLIQ